MRSGSTGREKASENEMTKPIITQTRSVFSLSCLVETNIQARAESIWKILTDARDYPRWNSMITRIEGEIRDGARLRLHVPGTDRTFAPLVADIVPNEHMTWTGGFAPVFKGVRSFDLKQRSDGSTDFAMKEHFAGLMLPLAKGSMPDFGPVFERFASDLKREAELRREP